ncbi:FAD/NAD(P)-binding protein [Methylobrevis albus]|uniref:FAD/NAD(P)-binding protein n=1 Tax=Methylobrevis albus TaxID=2793297 RepID=A0A931I4Y3_9HYPH|nr:FAD/NAD(P)-binding protein [Methylobrevis albus]MBH0238918.1 FAD/NAD(P)-binding protein [Methylobrevis albus]
MATLTRTDIAVIGGGLSASAVIAELVDRLPPSTTIGVVAPKGRRGRGVAYGTTDDRHLLNVPAGRMSLFSTDPDHFVRWLRQKAAGYGPHDFVPRRIYGDYVRDSLASAIRRTGNRSAVSFFDAEATGFAATDEGGYPFRLSNGDVVAGQSAVLCVGGAPAGLPLPAGAVDPAVADRLVADPWKADWIGAIEPDATVLFVGTGLTMIDQLVSLVGRGHRGPIHAMSRRGLLPHPHREPRPPAVALDLDPARDGLAAALSELRRAAGRIDDWRALMDGLRPSTQRLWDGLAPAQRRQFMRHLLPYWNAHRHRVAPAVNAEVEALRRTGRVHIRAGWLESITDAGGRARVSFRPRGTHGLETLTADVVVNCCGPDRCPSLQSSPLLVDLAARGVVTPDPTGLGIAVDRDSAVIAADGRRLRGLYAVGPLTAGTFWEITAVPEIRAQAAGVADNLARRYAN